MRKQLSISPSLNREEETVNGPLKNLSGSTGSTGSTGSILSCSRCLPITKDLSPLQWTLSTLNQTKHDSSSSSSILTFSTELNIHTNDLDKLQKQYHILQVHIPINTVIP